MKTERLAVKLRSIDACESGLEDLTKFDTVAQWWRKSIYGSYMVWLWVAVLYVYRKKEKILVEDIKDMFTENGMYIDDLEINQELSIHHFMDELGYHTIPYRKDDEQMAKWMRKTYRCPSDEELREVIRLIEEYNNSFPTVA